MRSTASGEISDADLVVRAGHGDRTAFGMLYLRHHLAAWRMATVASGFSDDAEVAVIDGFTNVFSALPPAPHEPGGDEFRRHLLVCVRRIALDRILPRRGPVEAVEPDAAGGGPGAGLLQAGLKALPEPSRTALWLSEVEGWAPGDVATALGLESVAVPALVADAAQVLGRHDRRTFPRRRGHTHTHLRPEPGPALAAAVPPVPALGGECQRRWLRERAMHASLSAATRTA